MCSKNVQIQSFAGGENSVTILVFTHLLLTIHLGRWAEQLLKLPGGNCF